MRMFKKSLSFLLVFAILLTIWTPVPVAAKSKIQTVKMKVGSVLQFKVSGSIKKGVWKSSKKSVATVTNKGKVTAKKAGTTKLTAKIGKKTYQCKIIVKKSNISLFSTSSTLNIGQSSYIKVKNKPKGAKVTYKSNAASIATVSSFGKVTARKAGTATMTVTIKNGDYKKSLEYKATVKAKNYTVSFNTNGGNYVAAQKIIAGGVASRPTDPIKTGYYFVGWYSDAKLAVKYNFSSKVNRNTVLHAKWNKLPESTYVVIFDSNGGDYVKFKLVKEGDTVSKPTDPTRSGYTFNGWYSDETFTNEYDFSKFVNNNLVLYAKWLPIRSLSLDTDGDGLSDEDEINIFYTNEYKVDTDDDTFTDFEEVHMMGTDPLIANETTKDTDGDGLSDTDEVKKYKTDCNLIDTDRDGLSDYDEIMLYATDPNSTDTDEDSLSDKFEVENHLDPTKKMTDDNTIDSDRILRQELSENNISDTLLSEDNAAKPSLKGTVSGEIDKVVALTQGDDETITDNRSVVGEPVVIDGISELKQKMTLSFQINDSDMNKYVIAKITDEGQFELITSEYDSDSISGEVSLDGLYCVVDSEKYLRNLGIDIESYWTTDKIRSYSLKNSKKLMEAESGISGQTDVVFVVDTTGSMSGGIQNVRNNITEFVNILSNNYNVEANFALIDFKDIEEDGSDTTKIVKNGTSNWYSNTHQFIEALSKLDIDGGGDIPESALDALETARNLNYRSSATKFIILVTDTNYKIANRFGLKTMGEEIEYLKSDGIITSVVTSMSSQGQYRQLFESTGGVFADIDSDNFSEELTSIIDLIGEKTSEGEWVILKHGYRYVKIKKIPEYGSAIDNDKDGILDYIELGDKETIDLSPWIKLVLSKHGVDYSEYIGKKSIEVYNATSDPSTNDTDGDGIIDSMDTEVWKRGLKDGIIGAIKICSYGTGPSSAGNFKGHAFVTYTSFIDDNVNLYGIKVDSSKEVAHEDDPRMDIPSYHSIYLKSGEYISIGGWADWLPEKLKGTWINNEFYLSGGEGWSDQRSLCAYITSSGLDQIEKDSKKNSNWSCLYNCSAYATDMWNDATGDNLSARGALVFRNPASLSNNIEKRKDYKVGDILKAAWP